MENEGWTACGNFVEAGIVGTVLVMFMQDFGLFGRFQDWYLKKSLLNITYLRSSPLLLNHVESRLTKQHHICFNHIGSHGFRRHS